MLFTLLGSDSLYTFEDRTNNDVERNNSKLFYSWKRKRKRKKRKKKEKKEKELDATRVQNAGQRFTRKNYFCFSVLLFLTLFILSVSLSVYSLLTLYSSVNSLFYLSVYFLSYSSSLSLSGYSLLTL